MNTQCPMEAEVLAAVVECAWPHRCSAELVEHARHCEVCADVALVASAVRTERQQEMQMPVPDAGRVWWKAQLRARREAIEAAGRPITAVQVLTLACAMGIIGACFGASSLWFQAGLHWLGVHLNAEAWGPAVLGLGVIGGAMVGMAALGRMVYRRLRRG